jgi:hypothetical protein
MKITRRNALIGMGTVAAGAGVIGGTGAFTSVQADRSVSVTTTGDSSAALQIFPATTSGSVGNGTITNNADTYTNANDASNTFTDGTLEITISNLNLDAVTRLEQLFTVVNNGNQEVTLDFQITATNGSISDIVGSSGTINIVQGTGGSATTTDITSGYAGDTNLTVGASSSPIGLEFDIDDDSTSGTSSLDLELTIRAQAV